MNVFKELETYYGTCKNSEVKNYLYGLDKIFDENNKGEFVDKVMAAYNKNYGMPDVAKLEKIKSTIQIQKPELNYWFVCSDCHNEYDAELECCPHCYKEGYYCRSHLVKTSEFPQPLAVTSYNCGLSKPQEFLGGKSCFSCESNYVGKCEKFGWDGLMSDGSQWICKDERDCPCRACCIRLRKANREIRQLRGDTLYKAIGHKNGIKLQEVK